MSPVRKQHELVRVTVEVRRVDDPAKARRLAELLADLLDAPAPDERRAK